MPDYPDKPKIQGGWHDVRIEELFEYDNKKTGAPMVGVVMLNNQGHEGILYLRNSFGEEEWSDKKWGRLFTAMGQEGKESRSDRNEQVKAQYGTPLRVKVDEEPGLIGMVLPLKREDKKPESFEEDVPF